MGNLLKNEPLYKKISNLFTDLENEINGEIDSLFGVKGKWPICKICPNYSSKISNEETRSFQLELEIKIRSGNLVIWNPEYKKEALHSSYSLVLTDIKNLSENLEQKILEKLDNQTTESIQKCKKYIQKKIKSSYKLVHSKEGRAYFYEDKRQSLSNSHSTKLDVIWHCNEKNHSISFPGEKMKGSEVLYDADYPFIGINITQWKRFESATKLIPILEKCCEILGGNNEPSIKKLPPLEQIIFIDKIREKISDFDSLSNDKKIFILNLLTNGQNHNLDSQLKALGHLIDLSNDDYYELEENASEWARLLKSITNSSLANLRQAVRHFTYKFIKKENDKNDNLLSEAELKFNEKVRLIRNQIQTKQAKIENLLKSLE